MEQLIDAPGRVRVHTITRQSAEPAATRSHSGNRAQRRGYIPTGMGGIFLYAGTAEGPVRNPDCF